MLTIQQIEDSKKEIVTVVNRFGREVDVSLYQARKMIKRGEGEIKVEAPKTKAKAESKSE